MFILRHDLSLLRRLCCPAVARQHRQKQGILNLHLLRRRMMSARVLLIGRQRLSHDQSGLLMKNLAPGQSRALAERQGAPAQHLVICTGSKACMELLISSSSVAGCALFSTDDAAHRASSLSPCLLIPRVCARADACAASDRGSTHTISSHPAGKVPVWRESKISMRTTPFSPTSDDGLPAGTAVLRQNSASATVQ